MEHKSVKKSTIERSIEVDQEIKLVVFATRPSSTKLYWIFAPLSEMIGTAFLTFGVFAIIDRAEILVTDKGNEDLFFSTTFAFLIAILLIG